MNYYNSFKSFHISFSSVLVFFIYYNDYKPQQITKIIEELAALI